MSIPDRLADAELLLRHDRHEGALIMVLVAIAATARKRYPNKKFDGDAFCTFLVDEFPGHNQTRRPIRLLDRNCTSSTRFGIQPSLH